MYTFNDPQCIGPGQGCGHCGGVYGEHLDWCPQSAIASEDAIFVAEYTKALDKPHPESIKLKTLIEERDAALLLAKNATEKLCEVSRQHNEEKNRADEAEAGLEVVRSRVTEIEDAASFSPNRARHAGDGQPLTLTWKEIRQHAGEYTDFCWNVDLARMCNSEEELKRITTHRNEQWTMNDLNEVLLMALRLRVSAGDVR